MSIGNEPEILLIEDNPDDAELTFMALKKNQLEINIRWFKNGEEALVYLFDKQDDGTYRHFPKLILLDLKLPETNGVQILKKIKDNNERNSLPVVVLSSSNQEIDFFECYKAGANSYIIKPVDFRHFSNVVKELCRYWLELNECPKNNQK